MPKILHAEFAEYGIDSGYYNIAVPNRVQIELGARSLNEPFDTNMIGSILDETYGDASFVEESFEVQSIIPEKTFLEKIILLHEEFQKPAEKIRSHRMSRHLYDIYTINLL